MATVLPSDHILARPIIGVIAAAEALGLDAAEACRRAGITPAALAVPDAIVPVDSAIALWRALEQQHCAPGLGVAVAERMPVGVLGFVYHSVHASETLRDACRRVTRYNRLVAGPMRITLKERGEEAALVYETRPAVATLPLASAEYFLMLVLRMARSALGAELVPREVRFVHAEPAAASRLAEAFGAPCRFGAERAELVLARSDLDRPVPSGDAQLARWLDVQGDTQLEAAERTDAAARVRAAVRVALSRGEPRLEEVATTLRMPPRTLQRRLSVEGTSFAAVVDDVRRDVALRMMAGSAVPIADCAFVTGFSELSAFYRAFRRWTGATPAEWRRRAEAKG
ncbi:Transcriptional regulator, AraC family protein [Minicystis rosea]|nr:Transcriptional regulator, AraC family protein [Minicystis rosea]